MDMRLTDPAGAADKARQMEQARPGKHMAGSNSGDQIASQSVEAAQGDVSRRNKFASDRRDAASKAKRTIGGKPTTPQAKPVVESSEQGEHHILDARA